MQEAVRLASECLKTGKGGPFGAVVVKDSEIVGRGANSVSLHNDPTAHAEILAIRDACRNLNTFILDDCELYTSCEPCPMCLGAIYWSHIQKIYYATSRKDADAAGFQDKDMYEEFQKEGNRRKIPMQYLPFSQALEIFEAWRKLEEKVKY